MKLTIRYPSGWRLVVLGAFFGCVSCANEPVSPELPDQPALTRPIVFARHDGNWNIYSIRPDGSGLTRLTDYDQDDLYPLWFGNHQRIAFMSQRDSGWIYSMKPDGSDIQLIFRNVLCTCMDVSSRFAVSPTGDRVAFASSDVRIAQKGDSATTRVAIGTQVTWHPDGTRLGFTSPSGLAVARLDGSDLRVLPAPEGAEEMAWSPNGQQIVYSVNAPGPSRVLHIANADGSNARLLTTKPAESIVFDRGASWSPDGKFIAFQREHESTACAPFRCYDIMVVRVDGLGLRNLTAAMPNGFGLNVRPTW